jgi:uncharacterized protein involved in exopolysaccharide biosynthesis
VTPTRRVAEAATRSHTQEVDLPSDRLSEDRYPGTSTREIVDDIAHEAPPTKILTLARRQWRWVAFPALGGMLLTVAILLLLPREYVSYSSFVPQTRRTSPSGLSGVAAQLGISVQADPGQSPQFYADLVKSRDLLLAVTSSRYEWLDGMHQRSGSLIDFWSVGGRTPASRQERALAKLQRSIASSVVAKTGVVTISARSRDPSISQQITSRILALINEFNTVTRQSQAAAERRFTERRLNEVASDLRTSENRLQGFLEQNREFGGSEGLKFERERLSRDVSMRQQVYASLAEAFEQAKIEEVRDMPVTTIIDKPTLPLRPAPLGLGEKSLFALIFGGLAGLLAAWLNERRKAFQLKSS